MRKVLFIQARMSSTRLPGKMLMDIGGIPLFEFVYRRCLEAKLINHAAFITSDDAADNILAAMCRERTFWALEQKRSASPVRLLCRKRALEEFNLIKQAKEYIELYESIHSERKS